MTKRFVEGEDRTQGVLLPEFLDDYVAEDNPVRAIDVFVDELDLQALGFEGVVPEETGRPAYHPATMLKIYVYGYVNQIQSSRRLERETARNGEMMWLTGRLTPDFKTIVLKNSEIGPTRKSRFRARRVISADSPHGRAHRSVAHGKTGRSAGELLTVVERSGRSVGETARTLRTWTGADR